jgi:hypothetical protein
MDRKELATLARLLEKLRDKTTDEGHLLLPQRDDSGKIVGRAFLHTGWSGYAKKHIQETSIMVHMALATEGGK